jgi:hypothetical protein
MSDDNLLWEEVDNLVRQWETFSGISGHQDSVQGLTIAVDIFEQFLIKDIVQKIVTETIAVLSSSKLQGQYFLQAVEGKWVAVHDNRRNVCHAVTIHANGYGTEAQFEIVLLTK